MEIEKESINNPSSPLSKIITVASIAAGVQFGWALQLSLLTPYVQTLGVPHAWASFIWLCGPLSGLFVQPIVGYYSDRCTSRFGRRRPFITGGAIMVILAVSLISFAKDIGYKSGDDINKNTKPRAVGIFVVGFWILDVANNTLQGPCRAFLADLCSNEYKKMRIANGCFAFFMALGNVMGYAAGSFSKLHKIFPFTKTEVCDTPCANLKSCFLIDIVILIIVTTIAITTVSETQVTKNTDEDEKPSSSIPFFGDLFQSFKQLKKPMWILLLVTCINWIAWFPFILYDTDWMGREIYGGDPEGDQNKKDIYDMGVRAGAMGLLLNSVVLAFTSLAIEPLGQLIGGVKRIWGIVNIILAVGLASMLIVSHAADSWRDQYGLRPPPASVKAPAFAIFSVLGIPLAVTFSVPFALASIYCSISGAGQGLSLGVVNLAVVLPQMFVSVVSGPLDNAFHGGNSPALVMGAMAAIISSMLALFVLPNPPAQAGAPTMMIGGGH